MSEIGRIKTDVRVKIPSVPNFLLAEDGKTSYPVAGFDDETLAKIGVAWTEKLIAHARSRRGKQL